jgi:hypothetical protein
MTELEPRMRGKAISDIDDEDEYERAYSEDEDENEPRVILHWTCCGLRSKSAGCLRATHAGPKTKR